MTADWEPVGAMSDEGPLSFSPFPDPSGSSSASEPP